MDSIHSQAVSIAQAALLHAAKTNNLRLLRELVENPTDPTGATTKLNLEPAIFCAVNLGHLEAFSFLLPLVECHANLVFDLADALVRAGNFPLVDYFIAQQGFLCWSEMMDMAFDSANLPVVQHLMTQYSHSEEQLQDLALESLTDTPPTFEVFDYFLSHYGLDCNALLLKAVNTGNSYVMPNFFKWNETRGCLDVVEVLARISWEGEKSSDFLEALGLLVDAVRLKLDGLTPEARTRVDALLDLASQLTI